VGEKRIIVVTLGEEEGERSWHGRVCAFCRRDERNSGAILSLSLLWR
jgi:hypothetical protein